MHGCGSGSALLVNAEVDSMGGVVDGGVGIGIKTSPRRAAIEKAQAELRQEYDVREERRRELEFLEKGGNPLDFKFGNAASVSVQSTSLIDHHAEHLVTSEAKGSFPLMASPHGDSVESSGRLGAPIVCEPNSADNFDGENDLPEVERKTKHLNRRSDIVPSEQSSQMDGAHNAKESEDSAIFRPYARRNRSRPNRDGARSSSNDVVQSSGGQGSCLPVRGGSRDAKGSMSETNSHKDQIVSASSNPKSTTSNGDMAYQVDTSNIQSNMELDGVQPLEIIVSPPKDGLDIIEPDTLKDNQDGQPSEADVQKTPVDVAYVEHNHTGEELEQVISGGPRCSPCASTAKNENETGSAHLNDFSDLKRDGIEDQNGNAAIATKGLDSESSCTQHSLSLDVNNDNDLFINHRNDDNNGILMKQIPEFDGMQSFAESEKGNEKNEIKAADSCVAVNDDHGSVHQNYSGNGAVVKVEEEIKGSDLKNEVKGPSKIEGVEQSDHTASEVDRKSGNVQSDDSNSNRENICPVGPQVSIQDLPKSTLSKKNFSVASEVQSLSIHLKLVDKAHEDSILEEARSIEAKRKRIARLSVGTMLSESHRKSHWDFVLEEMVWLANDFAQERIWKMTAAAQICRRASLTSRQRVEQQNKDLKLRRVAYTLAKAVMQFWYSAEVLLNDNDQNAGLNNCKRELRRFDDNDCLEGKFGELEKKPCKGLDQQNRGRSLANAIHGYAIRFLTCNRSPVPSLQAEAPATPERIVDSGSMDISWDDHLTEESLFYAVPSGAMEIYRTSIESHLVQSEKTRNSVQEEIDTSICDAAAEYGYHENAYDEEEGETSTYYLPGVFEGSKPTKHDLKKWKNLKSYSGRSYEPAAELPYGNFTVGSHQNILMGKRPANILTVGSIPTKRMRTASRQRVISPFSAGTTGVLEAPAKTDASSGETSSFQDDQSTLYGGSQMQRSMEVESVGDFEKQLPYDYAEMAAKMKKKKKSKHLGSAYEQGWHVDSTVHNEQRDSSKKRLESHHFDSNGNSGLYGQHTAKKPRMMKQLTDNTYDNMAPMSGSVPSPAASHMSNMSNKNRFMKLIGGRERGRKTKSQKLSAGQPGCGSPWSLFEDQALVVLVHDMGPNWELVSDAINGTLQFKCIFRKPIECRERHKVLMDNGAGDGADSAEDSGSSQSYPSTLPGIPKGSARQLFQRLQGPMEEDTLKSHFEKIIMIGKKLHYRRSQNGNQDPKQITPVHNSHGIALSQVCPNNLNGGFLTPLDFCNATTSSPDAVTLGYQGSHASGLTMPNQSTAPSMLPTSSANSPPQGSSGMVLGNNSPSPSGPLNAPARDSRYNVPRTSLPVDEQQRLQHYNQILSNRNMVQANLSVSGTERGVRILPGGNGVGMVPGMNRSLPLPRPGFQGMTTPPSLLNSGNMLSSGMVGMPSPVNIHAGTGSGQGNSVMRPREALHVMRPGHIPEHQRQMIVPELQIQVPQGNNQAIPACNGLSPAFANQTTPSSVQTYPGHPQQQHQMSPQQPHVLSSPHHPHHQGSNHASSQQAYAIRFAKERQMQQRLLQQQPQHPQPQPQPQQQQFAASSGLMPHVQHQPPIPSSMQNSSQIQPQSSSQPVSLPPLTSSSPMTPIPVQQQHQKHNLPHQGLSRNPQTSASGLTTQMGKQRQRQPQQHQFQHTSRHHPQQRQHSQSSQQAKLLKGMGRGNVVHQNLSMDHSHLNGLSVPSGNQGAEKGEQMMHLMQGQGLYAGSGLGPIQPSKPLVPSQVSNHTQPQQKLYSRSTNPSAKPHQQMPAHSENSAQGQASSLPSVHALSAGHQTAPAGIMASNHLQHLPSHPPPHQKVVSHAQSTGERVVHQNCQLNSDLPMKFSADQESDRQSLNNISQMSTSTTTAVPQASNDSANVVPVVSSAVAQQWKPSESPLYDSGMPNQMSQVGSPTVSSSSGTEPVASISQGLGQRQLSGGFSQRGHNAGTQWQQHAQLHQSTPPLPSQQLFHANEQQPQQEQQSPQLQSHSQHQTHQLQPAQAGIYIRPTNSNLE